MATKKKVTDVPVEKDIIKLENLVECIQQSLVEFNELIAELNEDFENVDFILFDAEMNETSLPKHVHITKTWSIE